MRQDEPAIDPEHHAALDGEQKEVAHRGRRLSDSRLPDTVSLFGGGAISCASGACVCNPLICQDFMRFQSHDRIWRNLMRYQSFCLQARIGRRRGRVWEGRAKRNRLQSVIGTACRGDGTKPENPHNRCSGGPESEDMGQGSKILLGHSGHPLNPRIKDAICRREHSGLTRTACSGCIHQGAIKLVCHKG